MKTIVFCVALFAIPACAWADSDFVTGVQFSNMTWCSPGGIGGCPPCETTIKPDILFVQQGPPAATFVLHAGGCLRGPLDVNDMTGAQIFHLDAGKWFPVGCNK